MAKYKWAFIIGKIRHDGNWYGPLEPIGTYGKNSRFCRIPVTRESRRESLMMKEFPLTGNDEEIQGELQIKGLNVFREYWKQTG